MSLLAVTLPTERLILKSTTRSDLADLMRLWNDGSVMRWVGFPDGLGYDPAKAERWFAGMSAAPDRHHFVVRDRLGGFCGEVYAALDRSSRRASLDIKFVPSAHGGGRSREALGALIEWVFESFPEIDAVWTEPNEGNLAATTLYYSCGMRVRPRPVDLPHPGPSYWERTRALPAVEGDAR